jgi:hypothetical protein
LTAEKQALVAWETDLFLTLGGQQAAGGLFAVSQRIWLPRDTLSFFHLASIHLSNKVFTASRKDHMPSQFQWPLGAWPLCLHLK